MFARLLALPFVAISLALLYVSWEIDSDYALWMVPPVLIAALFYIFSPQINWWWYVRYPPELETGLRKLLERHCGFYGRLDAAQQRVFRSRVALFRMGTDWMPMAWPDELLPADVELAIAAQAVTMTMYREELLFPGFEKVIVYPKPFPSPEYLFAHASELYAPDGCLLFSAEQVMLGFMQPAAWYNVALHEYAKAYLRCFPEADVPALYGEEEEVWSRLEAVSGMTRERIEAVIGIAGIEPLPVAMHHYFIFPGQMQRQMPAVYARLHAVFGGKHSE
jgi:Mlc titration factor MtfA (ptsG expression regulator)